MPDLSSDLTALRADGHKVAAYLAPLLGSVVASGTLTSAPTTGAVALVWNRTAGSSAAIKPGFKVVVESGAGLLKYTTSVRYSGTISDTNLPVRELATAEFTLSAADVIKVYNVPVLTDKLVEANATFAPDGITYSAQNTTISPLASSGGLWVGFVDAGQTYATVVTSGSGSFTVDPDSGGTVTHLWTLPSGVAFQAGSANTDASPTLEADAGYALVTHTVTDSSNSATWTQYLPLRVFSAADMPTECVIDQINGDLDAGWSGTIRLFDDAEITDIPDRSLVAVFVQETINGAAASYGNRVPSRSHIKLVGYLARETAEGDGANDDLTVEIISPWARLQEIPGFSKVLERYVSTTGWRYLQGLTVKKAIIQILRWYTNWTEFWDIGFDTFTDYNYPALNLEKATPLGQLIELADAADGRVTGDRTGAMRVHTRPELVALASRSSLTTTLTLTDDDRISYRFSRDYFRQVEQLECRGFTAATTTAAAVPIFSRYPGVPGRGVMNTAVEKLIATSQTDLNNRCGLRGAALDGVFITTAGLYHRAVELELTLPGAYDVFDPAYQEWIAFTGAAGNRRALDLSAFRFVLRSVNVTYANGTAQSNLRLVSETAAPAGKTYVPPATTGINPDINLDFPPITFPDIGGGGIYLNAGTARIALICQGGLARTTNFGAGAATVWDWQPWSSFSPAESSSSGAGAYLSVPDAFTYASGTVKCWVVYSTTQGNAAKIYYLDVANRTWTLVHTMSSATWDLDTDTLGHRNAGADASFAVQNHFAAAFYGQGDGTQFVYTTDNSTFTEQTLTSVSNTAVGPGADDPKPQSLYVSSKTAGLVTLGIMTTSSNRPQLQVSTDYGSSFSADMYLTGASSETQAPSKSIHYPWDPARNADESIFFYGSGVKGSLAGTGVYRVSGGSYSVIKDSLHVIAPRNGLSTFTGNANRLLACLSSSVLTISPYPYLTDNALAATPTWTALSTAVEYEQCAIAGDAGNVFYFWGGYHGTAAAVGLSNDSGATIISQVGDLTSYTSSPVMGLLGW